MAEFSEKKERNLELTKKMAQTGTRKPTGKIQKWETVPRLFQEIATRAIRNLNDGLIELIWNSYDAYRFRAKEKSPIVHIVYQKVNGSFSIEVRDEASGATKKDLTQALTMGAESPERLDDERVRSFFGLGLKQTLLALADMNEDCSVVTIKDGLRHQTHIWPEGVEWETPTMVGDHHRTLFTVKFYLKKEREKDAPKSHVQLANVLSKDFRLKFILPMGDGYHKNYTWPVLTILVHSNFNALKKYLMDGTKKDTIQVIISPSKFQLRQKINKKLPTPHKADCRLIIYKADKPFKFGTKDPLKPGGILIADQPVTYDLTYVNLQMHFGEKIYRYVGLLNCTCIGDAINNYNKALRFGKSEEPIFDTDRRYLNQRHPLISELYRFLKNELRDLVRRDHPESGPKNLTKTSEKVLDQMSEAFNTFFEDYVDAGGRIESNKGGVKKRERKKDQKSKIRSTEDHTIEYPLAFGFLNQERTLRIFQGRKRTLRLYAKLNEGIQPGELLRVDLRSSDPNALHIYPSAIEMDSTVAKEGIVLSRFIIVKAELPDQYVKLSARANNGQSAEVKILTLQPPKGSPDIQFEFDDSQSPPSDKRCIYHDDREMLVIYLKDKLLTRHWENGRGQSSPIFWNLCVEYFLDGATQVVLTNYFYSLRNILESQKPPPMELYHEFINHMDSVRAQLSPLLHEIITKYQDQLIKSLEVETPRKSK